MLPRHSGSRKPAVSHTRVILQQDSPRLVAQPAPSAGESGSISRGIPASPRAAPGPHSPFCTSRRELLTIVHHFCASRSSSKLNTMGSSEEPRTVSSWHVGLLTLYEMSLRSYSAMFWGKQKDERVTPQWSRDEDVLHADGAPGKGTTAPARRLGQDLGTRGGPSPP